jgi:hypothetical protein
MIATAVTLVFFNATATISLAGTAQVAEPSVTQTDVVPLVSPKAPDGKVLVLERTPVKLTLDEDLKSGSCKSGDQIEYDLTNDLYTSDRQLVAPAGTKAYGKVLKSSGHGMFGKPGKLEISADYILAPDRTHIPLRGDQIGNGGKNEVVGMVAMTLLVSVLGVFINGRDVNLHKGQEIPMYVDSDTVTTPYMSLVGAGEGVKSLSSKTLYTLNDGTQIVGVQNAFDGTTYAITTDNGVKLIKATEVKSIFQIANLPPAIK